MSVFSRTFLNVVDGVCPFSPFPKQTMALKSGTFTRCPINSSNCADPSTSPRFTGGMHGYLYKMLFKMSTGVITGTFALTRRRFIYTPVFASISVLKTFRVASFPEADAFAPFSISFISTALKTNSSLMRLLVKFKIPKSINPFNPFTPAKLKCVFRMMSRKIQG